MRSRFFVTFQISFTQLEQLSDLPSYRCNQLWESTNPQHRPNKQGMLYNITVICKRKRNRLSTNRGWGCEFNLPFTSINGLKTFYEVEGKGKPLVLVHGAGGATTYWFNQLSGLSSEFRVIAIDLPGHGKSEPLKGKPSIEQYAKHLDAFINGMKLSKVVLLGHSMGGLIVQHITLNHPEIVEKLIIVDSSAKFPGRSGSGPSFRHAASMDANTIAASLFSQKTLRKTDATSLMKQIIRGMSPEFALNVLLRDFELADEVDFTGRLKAIGAPTLIVHGADDVLPVSLANYLHENIKGSKLEIIPDAGHMVMMEKPTEFNNAIMKFIKA
jgi:pimeloyl-ACP methyl ester carboxylesterase